MHNKLYYRNSNGDTDHHAKKMAGKIHDMNKTNMRKLSEVNDGNANYDPYTLDVQSTLGAKVEGLNKSRENTKLALRQPLSIVPRDEIARAITERDFSLVPIANTLPTPVKPRQIMLAA